MQLLLRHGFDWTARETNLDALSREGAPSSTWRSSPGCSTRRCGVPVFELSSRNGVDVSLAPECHHHVDVTNELLVDECGRPFTDVDTNLGHDLRRQIVDECD